METSQYSHTLLQESEQFCLASIASNGHGEYSQISLKATLGSVGILEALVNVTAACRQDILLQLPVASPPDTMEQSQFNMAWELNIKSPSWAPRCHRCSEGALEQAVASTARGTHLLGAKPLHHMAGVASVSTGQAEVRGASHRHVTDSALEGEALADGTLGAAHLAAAVAAVHAKLCPEERNGEQDN